ncbi:MAG: hypothetical protein IT573_00310 [Deltaproteobacteria bacterium]|nr:hypothetical protein [Deltaproteobacteria bacterium]
MKSLFKYIGAAAVVILGVVSVSYLQHRFDQSDLRHAVGAVRFARPQGPQGATLEEQVAYKFQTRPELISWEPQLESKLEGTVLVRALPPQGGENLIWKVDLVRMSVVPITPEAEAFSKTNP